VEEDEFIQVVRIPLEEAVRMVLDGEIKDLKTALGILLTRDRLSSGADRA